MVIADADHLSHSAMVSDISGELAAVRQQLSVQMGAKQDDVALTRTDAQISSTSVAAGTSNSIRPTSSVCWQKRGGCHCRCHITTRHGFHQSRYFFLESYGWSALAARCNIETCNARTYGFQIRIAGTQARLPFALTTKLQFRSDCWLPRVTLTPERVCRYTAPGFVILWDAETRRGLEADEYYALFRASPGQKVADFKRLLSSDEASFEDVDPEGKGYLDKLLERPWLEGSLQFQWELLEFILQNSPERVLARPTLLHQSAQWIWGGLHMDLLRLLLRYGINPGNLDASTSMGRPNLHVPICLTNSVPDPMFLEWPKSVYRSSPVCHPPYCCYVWRGFLTAPLYM